MIIRDKIIHFPIYSFDFLQATPELCLFFDIETTGLSWKHSHLYMLGVVYFENSQWIKKQWFCQRPSEEQEVLKEFSSLLNSRKYLLHYNGASFDIPYLMHKYTFYQLEQSWEHLISHDLYQWALPFKKILGMEQMKQKDLEIRMGIKRNDPYSGGELISFYQDYLKSGDEMLLECLFLHNGEDMDGLVKLTAILYLKKIFQGNMEIFQNDMTASISSDCLCLKLNLKELLPLSCSVDTTFYKINLENNLCDISVPIVTGIKKYFFSDYKNYYYLKYEDTAIHKSVGAYVDKEYRENAKANNCYQKKEGQFLPQFDFLFEPLYKDNLKDSISWFEVSKNLINSQEELSIYASHLLSHTVTLVKTM